MLEKIDFNNLTVCPICESRNLSYFSKVYQHPFHLSYMRCDDCTFVFMNPQITQNTLKEIFSSNSYWKGTLSYADYSRLKKINYLTARKRTKYLSRFLSTNARILEVGCASGHFLHVCQELGFSATGIDVSSYQFNIDQTSAGNNIKMINTSLDDYVQEFNDDLFDAVCLWGIEGNFPDLVDTFRKVYCLLNTAGLLTLNWMNFDHWLRPILFGSFRQRITALSNLTPQSYKILLQKTHFKQIFSTEDYQYVNFEKFCSLSGHSKILKILRILKISQLSFPLPTILGKLAILQKSNE